MQATRLNHLLASRIKALVNRGQGSRTYG